MFLIMEFKTSMKKISIVSILIFVANLVSAQIERVQTAHTVNLTFIGLSYAYEQSLGEKTSINLELMLVPFRVIDVADGKMIITTFTPVLRVEPRYYFKFQNTNTQISKQKLDVDKTLGYLSETTKQDLKDLSKKTIKNLIKNSAKYFSLSADYQFGVSLFNDAYAERKLSLIPKLGLKQEVGNHYIFDLAAGIGACTIENEGWVAAFGFDLKFGYLLYH